MKQIIYIGLILLSAVNVAGQVQYADSLVDVLETKGLTNKEQIELCYKIFDRYVLSDLMKASVYAGKGLRLAEKDGDKIMASRFNAAFGRIYNTKSSYDTALVYWNKALDLAVAADDKLQEASVHIGIGVLYARQEEQTPALEHFIKALSIFENAGNMKRCITILGNIASIYRAMDNNERAVYYLEKAKNIAEEFDDDNGKMQVCYELSAIYCSEGKINQALEYAQKSYEISRRYDDKIYQGGSTEVLSAIYYDHLKDYDTAWKYASECLQLAGEIGDLRMIAGAWKVISNLNMVQGRYKESETAARMALEVDSTNLNINLNLMENIVLSNILQGNKDDAVTSFREYIALINRHIDYNSREMLADMETKYETEKKEMRISSLERERRLYAWLGVAGGLLVIALVIVLCQTLRNARKEKQLIATRSVLDGEMRERSRLAQDLHDRLSGNLSAIKIGLNNQEESLQDVRDKLDNCIRDIRDAAHDLMPASLQSGMRVALEDFAAQFPDVRFHFFGKDGRINERLEFVIYCCANELVNNSVKYSGSGNINLQLVQDERYVTLTVSDDGCGFDEKGVVKGLGLKSVRDRVASCNGKIDISTLPGKGTEITIELKTENPG